MRFYKNGIDNKIIESRIQIESWFNNAFINQSILLSTSVDLRDAGYKLAPVDTNLFPAGFNNLNVNSYPFCVQSLKSIMKSQYLSCKRILIIPENHTRNIFYFESLAVLSEVIVKAGFDVRIAVLFDLSSVKKIDLPSGKSITLYPIERINDKLKCDNFEPDLILLNNDLSDGVPFILDKIIQPITPLPKLGWAHRHKSIHFDCYNKICSDFSNFIGIDSWEISPLFEDCGQINFIDGGGESCLIEKTGRLFDSIKLKYAQYNIQEPPFIVIKAEQGTYGMAVMMIHHLDELKALNRKQRQNMGKIKGGKPVTKVIIQEGIYTRTMGKNNLVAEPVMYMMGRDVVGGFYRVHPEKGSKENLNSPGMHFEDLDITLDKFYVYSVVSRLALLATSLEIKGLEV